MEKVEEEVGAIGKSHPVEVGECAEVSFCAWGEVRAQGQATAALPGDPDSAAAGESVDDGSKGRLSRW